MIVHPSAPTSAREEQDFDRLEETVTFPPGEDTASIYIRVINDDDVEPEESFTVGLSSTKSDIDETRGNTIIFVKDEDGMWNLY